MLNILHGTHFKVLRMLQENCFKDVGLALELLHSGGLRLREGGLLVPIAEYRKIYLDRLYGRSKSVPVCLVNDLLGSDKG